MLEFDENNVFLNGPVQGGDGQFTGTAFGFGADSRFAVRDSVTTDISGGVRWDPTDRLAVLVDIQKVEATTDSLDFTVFNRYDFPSFNLDLRGGIPAVTFGPADYGLDPSNTYWSAAMDHHDDNEGEQIAYRADVEYELGGDSWIKSFRAGARATDRDNINRETTWNWGFISEWWGGAPLAFFDQFGPEYTHLYTFDNFMRGEAGLPSALWFPNMELVELGPGSVDGGPNGGPTGAYAILQGFQTAGWGWVPFNGDYESAAAVSYQSDPNLPGFGQVTGLGGGINNQHEETRALYAMVRFGGESFLGSGLEWDGNLGGRYVETETSAVGFARFPEPIVQCPTCSPDVLAFANGGQNDVSFENEYDNFLPSLNLRIHLNDDLQWRFAASKAITRPNLIQLQPILLIGAQLTIDQATQERSFQDWSGFSGNPLLKPMEANQLDTALEWYFAPSGSLYGTVFYKDISNFIVSSHIPFTVTNNGVTQTVNLTSPANLEEATIQGFEVGYQQFYDFLPSPFDGFGLQANFTSVDSEGGGFTSESPFDPTQVGNSQIEGAPLEGLSETAYNIAALYEKGRISARLAYNWRDQYLLTTSQANDNNAAWATDYGQLDGSIFFNITDNVKIGLQGVNLLDERTEILQQDLTDVHAFTPENLPSMLFDHHWHKTDRRYSFVVRATF